MASRPILLITGGTGYIWSHAVVAFEQAGYQTVIVDNLSNSSKNTLIGIQKILGYTPDFYECDIRDALWLSRIFWKYSFDGVVHFAGLKSVGESCRDIFEYQSNNVGGTITLFGIMKQFSVRKIVFSSSATVYRADNIPPFHEDMPTGTTNPYGTTKLVIEKLLEDYVSHAGWSGVSLRYFNPIGAHPSGHIGEIPNGTPNNLLPYVLDVARWKREKVSIYGNDYPTPDGTWVRDYIDINDLIDAHVVVYRGMKAAYSVYNVGTWVGTSVSTMIDIVSRVTGRTIPYTVSSRRPGDLAEVYATSEKIQNDYGWKARSSVETSVSHAWNFITTQEESHVSLPEMPA